MNSDEQPLSPHDEAEAIEHAQAYLKRIRSSTTDIALDQALLEAQNYFKGLHNCNLITLASYHQLNREALADAEHRPTAEPFETKLR